MPFLLPNQQRQSTEGNNDLNMAENVLYAIHYMTDERTDGERKNK